MLSMSTAFDFPIVSIDKESDIHLDMILSAPEKKDNKRIPLHLVLAIDCSGSMNDSVGTSRKSKLDQVKETTLKLVDHLTEADSLGIVGFSDNAWDVFKPAPMIKDNKSLIKKAVNDLRYRGSTNIGEAITMSVERAATPDKTKVSRVVFLTDGLPTVGVCSREGLIKIAQGMNPGISITTFGYGNDFDSELMTSVCRAGRGNTFHIKENVDCDRAFATELGGLLSLYAQNIKITVNPSGNITLKELLSDYKCLQVKGYRLLTRGHIEIEIDDIYTGETKHIVLKMAVPKATEAVCARPTTVCSILVSYTDVKDKTVKSLDLSAKVQYAKADKVPTEPDKEVQKQLMMLEAAKLQKEINDKAQTGDMVGTKSMLNAALTWAQSNAKTLPNAESYITAFQNMASSADMNEIRTTGSSYYRSMTMGRVTSNDAVFAKYCG